METNSKNKIQSQNENLSVFFKEEVTPLELSNYIKEYNFMVMRAAITGNTDVFDSKLIDKVVYLLNEVTKILDSSENGA